MINNHEEFKKKLDYSRPAVGVASTILTSRGFGVLIPPDLKAEQFNDREEYSDTGDMIAIKNKRKYLIEVKRIGSSFIKWKFKDFIVDRCATFDKKDPVPDMYIAMSSDLKAYGAVRKKNFKHMFKEVRNNPTQKSKSPYYIIDLKYVEFGTTGLLSPDER